MQKSDSEHGSQKTDDSVTEGASIPAYAVDAEANASANAAAWAKALETFFEVEDVSQDDADPFRAEIESYAMGPILFGRARAGGQRFRRSSATIARSGVDHVIVQLYVAGGFEGTAGSEPITVRPGDICLFDLAQTLETVATPFENFTLVVPHAMLDWRLAHTEILHGLVLPRESVLAGLLARHFKTLFEVAPRMTPAESHAVAEATVGLIVACLRGEIERRDVTLGGTSAATLIRIRRHIETQLREHDLSAESVAAHFGMSRSSLYRLFAPLGGIADYIRARRLHRALFDLATPDARGARVSDVARRWRLGTETLHPRLQGRLRHHAERRARSCAVGKPTEHGIVRQSGACPDPLDAGDGRAGPVGAGRRGSTKPVPTKQRSGRLAR